LEILIPDSYVENIAERLSLYTRLDSCENDLELESFKSELTDRFGPMPMPVEDLFRTVRSRRMAVALGFEKMLLKDNTLKCFFVANPESPYFQSDIFNKLLQYISTKTNKAKLKQVGKNGILVVTDIKTMTDLIDFIERMHNEVLTTTPIAKTAA
jgi:transcription-repair coupling factor (superfamily II helicase)